MAAAAASGAWARGPAPAGRELPGSIEGVVTIQPRAPRRIANRYPAGDPAARTLQEIPTVAYLEGVVPGSTGAPQRPFEIVQQDTAFLPAALVVPVGSTVAFPNRDPFFHNVFSYSPAKRFDLGRYPSGESKSVVFDAPGVVKIYCEVHDHMRSAVVVVQNPHHAVVGEDGRFDITGVPAGRYRLVVWHAELRPWEGEVIVPENGVVQVRVTLS
jgi:plastocyanin